MSAQLSRIQNLKNKFKNTYNNYIEENSRTLRTGIERVERFVKENYITISEDMDDYADRQHNHNTKRLIIVLITRVALILQGLRFGIGALINKHSVKSALMDFIVYGRPAITDLGRFNSGGNREYCHWIDINLSGDDQYIVYV